VKRREEILMWNNWITRWEKTIEAIKLIGGDSNGILVGKPATEQQVINIEEKLGYRLPESFRDVLLNFAGSVDFGWELNDCVDLPEEFREIFAGECIWDVNNLIDIEESREDWVRECFPNPDDEYDRVWHNKLAFMSVGNGDEIAIDLEKYPDYTPVVYLSHDGGEGHGYILGQDFKDFIDRWTLIGCPGSEDWQMLPFIDTPTSGINPNCENALEWKRLIGLEF
jgi:cell wall assembly regulator SMI1